jgi:hypothetical protein
VERQRHKREETMLVLKQLRERIPSAEWAADGTAVVGYRNGWGITHRGERQALPAGSSPLALAGEGGAVAALTGQEWTAAEAAAFLAVVGGVVFEFPAE